jgi:enoyl-CoA hydratase
MGTLVSYQPGHSVATITMDDGKVNALSPQMLSELGAALDRAAEDRAVVVLTGRPGTFSAGFDLRVLRGGGATASAMVDAGFELAERLLSFPTPVRRSARRPGRCHRGLPRVRPREPGAGRGDVLATLR